MPTGGSASKVEWSTQVKPDSVRPGATVTLHFDAAIEEGWKMYALDAPPPTRSVKVRFGDLPAGWTAGAPEQQTPETGFDPNFQKGVTWFAGAAHLWADVTVPTGSADGAYDLRAVLTFMVCSKTMCLPPTQVDVSETVTVSASGSGAAPSESGTTGDGGTTESND
jgi:thiol:disulfide interchange protein DsbD